MRCLSCGSNLRELRGDRCPECGSEFDSNNPETFAPDRGPPFPVSELIAILIVAPGGGLILALIESVILTIGVATGLFQLPTNNSMLLAIAFGIPIAFVVLVPARWLISRRRFRD